VKENPEQLMESEALFSFLSCRALLLAVGTGYITSENCPAAHIGNLYYTTWLSLLVSAWLTWSCLRIITKSSRRNRKRATWDFQI